MDKNKRYITYGIIGLSVIAILFIILVVRTNNIVKSTKHISEMQNKEPLKATYEFMRDILSNESILVQTTDYTIEDNGDYKISVMVQNNMNKNYVVKAEQLYIDGEYTESNNQLLVNSVDNQTSEFTVQLNGKNARTIKYRITLYNAETLEREWISGDTVIEFKDEQLKIYKTSQLNKIINNIEIVSREPIIVDDLGDSSDNTTSSDNEEQEDNKSSTYEEWAEQNGEIVEDTLEFSLTSIGDERVGYFELPDKFIADGYNTYTSAEGVEVRIDYFENIGGVELTAATVANFIDSGLETTYNKIYGERKELFLEGEETYDYIVYIDCMFEIDTVDKDQILTIFTFTSPSDIKDSVMLSIAFPREYDINVIDGYVKYILDSYKNE